MNLASRQLLQAASHKWGEGKVHVLADDGSRTLCGKTRDQCGGEIVHNQELNCLVCQKALETEARNAEYQRQWQQRETERAETNRQFWADYDRYLDSPEWLERRRLVLKRAQGLCEGCGLARASQIHHLTYARVFREMLFDLAAVCDACHREIHRDKER